MIRPPRFRRRSRIAPRRSASSTPPSTAAYLFYAAEAYGPHEVDRILGKGAAAFSAIPAFLRDAIPRNGAAPGTVWPALGLPNQKLGARVLNRIKPQLCRTISIMIEPERSACRR